MCVNTTIALIIWTDQYKYIDVLHVTFRIKKNIFDTPGRTVKSINLEISRRPKSMKVNMQNAWDNWLRGSCLWSIQEHFIRYIKAGPMSIDAQRLGPRILLVIVLRNDLVQGRPQAITWTIDLQILLCIYAWTNDNLSYM